jgi:hypothetical protein
MSGRTGTDVVEDVPGAMVVGMIVVGAFGMLLLAMATAVVAGMEDTAESVVEVGWMMLAACVVVVGMIVLVGFW